ncbi:MAG: nucleotidyl transferase AbiEii/AbiGii toxin family protein [bacterium]
MRPLLESARHVQDLLRSEGWKFCFIGGVALQRWGEPRVTQDMDVTLLTGFGLEEQYIDILLALLPSRIPHARAFALQNRVLLLKTESEIGIDIALGALPFEKDIVQRATEFEFLPGIVLTTCSAEDLIVMKAFADRDRDWVDIRGIIERQRVLDSNQILRELAPLVELKEAPGIILRLEKLLAG